MGGQSAALPLLSQGAHALGLDLQPEQVLCFSRLAEQLLAWNRRVNLTSITRWDQIQVKHFLDSLTAVPPLLERLGGETGTMVDVGTGGGLPGLAVAIAVPTLQVTLVEATAKKVAFLEHAIQVLGTENARALHGRAEELARSPAHRERYDFAVGRAVGTVSTLVELLVPFVRVGGWAIVMKTRRAADREVRSAALALERLSGLVEAVLPVDLPGLQEGRALVIVRKTAPTSSSFPRRSGIPHRRPL